jgi:hypothetical protein
MKAVCKKTQYCPDPWEGDIDYCITIGKVYDTVVHPEIKWLYKIIDDNGKEQEIGKECFEPLRDINLDKLLDL